MDETTRRKRIIVEGRTDLERWADAAQLETAWEPRSVAAAAFIPAGSAVLDIGCGAMALERHLPFSCRYQPADVVPRDGRTLVVDLNTDPFPAAAASEADVVTMLGVWEYLYDPDAVFKGLSKTGRPIVCSYCVRELLPSTDRRALGWVNDFSSPEFLALAARHGYRPAAQQVNERHVLYKLVTAPEEPVVTSKHVHVLSYFNVANFGDRLGYHMLTDVLPPGARVTWGTLRPFTPPQQPVDLLVVGIGNSLFSGLLDEQLVAATRQARAAIGIFGTQYRELWPKTALHNLLDRLTCWYARYEEDISIYARGRDNVRHLGDWLINACPLTTWTDEKHLAIGAQLQQEMVPLDRVIQGIQRHRSVYSERLHPLLCALTSAEQVGYKEQREESSGKVASGKFRSLLLDVFSRCYPEEVLWPVDRDAVARYKVQVRRNTDELKAQVAELLC